MGWKTSWLYTKWQQFIGGGGSMERKNDAERDQKQQDKSDARVPSPKGGDDTVIGPR